MVEDRAQQNIESAMTTNVEFGRALIQISKLPPAEHADGLKTVVTLLDSLKDTLRLDVQMFLGPDGKLIKGPD